MAQQEISGVPGRWEFGPAPLAPDPNGPAVVVSGHITGVVTALGSGLPLSGADVWLYRPDGIMVSALQTDPQGAYQFTNVLSGTYKVRFDAFDVSPGYGVQWYSGQSSLDTAAPIAIAENATAANINAVLSVGGHITGTLTGADSGLPLQGVRVRARDANGASESSQSVTDAAGHYDIAGIRTGSHRVQFFPPSFSPSSMYLLGYYHAKPSSNGADLVGVTAPGVTPNVNDTLQHGGAIGGHVTGADTGLPVPGVQVNVYPSCSPYPVFGSGVNTDAGGAYTITRALPSGSYRVVFTPPVIPTHDYVPQVYNHRSDLLTADPVNVTAPGISNNVDAILDIGGMLTGTVTISGTGQPLPGTIVTATTSSSAIVRTAYTDGAGEYRFLRLPSGVYYVTTIAGTRQYYHDRTSLDSADPITLTAPNVVHDINFQSRALGYLTGFVHDPSGNPLIGVRVLALNNAGHLVESRTTTDPDNFGDSYEFNDLPPGVYRLLFAPPSARTGYNLDAFNYGYQYYSNKLDFAAANTVVVTDGMYTTGNNVTMTLGAHIAGYALWQGATLDNIDVRVLNANGHVVADGVAGPGYETGAVPSGDYRVQFDATAYAPTCTGPFMLQYYNGKSSLATANMVHVSVPHTTLLMDQIIWSARVFLPGLRR